MKADIKSFFKNLFLIVLCLSIPFMLCLYAIQSKKYTDLSKEVTSLEKKQEKLIEDNKKLVNEISVLTSADRIEKMAVDELGMHKAEASDIVRVEMTGEKK